VALAKQGFWYDEATTAYLVGLRPGSLVGLLPDTESTPPLYYLIAWVWSRAFGSHEAGLRSLSALAGVLTVLVMYGIGRELASRRAGLVAAALTATSPLLVWYSQEARSYALFALLSAVSFLLFLRARADGSRLALAAWAAASSLALATHYLSALLVLPEAGMLLALRRRDAVIAVGATALVVAALAPLALEQLSTQHTTWIAKIPLSLRLRQLAEQFVGGFGATTALLLCAAGGIAVGGLLLGFDERRRRGAAGLALAVGGSGLVLALCLAALGADELLTRNLIAVWPPLAAALAVGLAAPKRAGSGLVATALVCGAWVATDLRVDRDVALQRPDWRRVLRALGEAHAPRLLVLEHYPAQLPLRIYDPTIRRLHNSQTERTAEVDVIAARVPTGGACWWGSACNLSPGRLPSAPPGLRPAGITTLPDFRIARFTATHPLTIGVRRLRTELVHVGTGAVLKEGPLKPGSSY
jgi:mannosyltransferase